MCGTEAKMDEEGGKGGTGWTAEEGLGETEEGGIKEKGEEKVKLEGEMFDRRYKDDKHGPAI